MSLSSDRCLPLRRGSSAEITRFNLAPLGCLFAALAEFERELIRERTIAGLAAARARGRNGGRKPKMTPAKLRLAQAAMGKRGTIIGDLCKELGLSSQTLYRHVSPSGDLRADGRKLISKTNP
jgi:DNA invertase Pin-like site-specific DNA recombinase